MYVQYHTLLTGLKKIDSLEKNSSSALSTMKCVYLLMATSLLSRIN